jgi:alpha-glucosidase
MKSQKTLRSFVATITTLLFGWFSCLGADVGETVVLNAEVAKSVVIARHTGDRWYLAGMNGNDAAMLAVPLRFIGGKKWDLREFTDQPAGASYEAVLQRQITVEANSILHLNLLPAGGYAAVLCPTQ